LGVGRKRKPTKDERIDPELASEREHLPVRYLNLKLMP
jgi:hypothetical protein